MGDDVRYLKKNIRTGTIDVHPTEKALIVNYELQATIFGELGNPMAGDRKECQKIIRVKNLDSNTNIPKLAQEIVDSCKLIQPSKIPEVEHLLHYLLSRKEVSVTEVKSKSSNKPADPGAFDSTEIDETANLNDTDEYLELLYEDIPDKLKASAMILQLARNPDNLEELYDNGTLIGALARVLREDWKESTDLATNIIYIFFCFSSFSDFHQIIIHFKIGTLTMNIIDHELKKYDMWMEELKKKRAEQHKDLDKTTKKVETMIRKQEQLFRVSYYMLLNVAEDISLEIKMLSKDLIEMLAKTLERQNVELLILIVSFLKKLSIYSENKADLVKYNVVERLAKHIPNNNIDLLSISLRLLLNMSFDSSLRLRIVKSGLLPKLINLSQSPENETLILCILYNISCEDKYKSCFIKTDCIHYLMKMILECKTEKVPIEIIALSINIVCNPEIALCITEKKGLRLLMKRAYKNRDYMIMKMLRNISQQEGEIKLRFLDYISDLAEVITNTSGKFEHEFIVECVGILSNLTVPDLDFEMILKEFNLVEWIKQNLQPKKVEDDLLLEVVMLVGTVSNDNTCAKMVADAGIIQSLIDLITAKQEDDEIVCQIVYVFYQLIFHESTRKIIIEKTQAPAYIIDLMHDKNAEIRKVCDWTLDIISEFDKEWADKIQQEKFRWYNSQWLEMIEGGANTPELDPAEDPAFLYDTGINYPFSTVGADDLLNRYEMLMSGMYDENGLPLDRSSSPVIDPSLGSFTDEFGRPIPMSNYMRFASGDLFNRGALSIKKQLLSPRSPSPYDRPDNRTGFRSDMAIIEHNIPVDKFGRPMMTDVNDESLQDYVGQYARKPRGEHR